MIIVIKNVYDIKNRTNKLDKHISLFYSKMNANESFSVFVPKNDK